MANSVTPVNVIEIDEKGNYTVRTETTIKTTEIKFRLGEEFEETTIDGRVTRTLATRDGNVLTLEQKATKRAEMDSRMVRAFRGNRMDMEMSVEGAVCRRIYERIGSEREE